jgi:hypothetical protein
MLELNGKYYLTMFLTLVFVTCLKWQKAAYFKFGWRNIKFTSVVIIMNKEMILYSYLYSDCVGPAAGRRTHIHTLTHTHTLSPLYRRFNTTLIVDLNISLATVYFILVLFCQQVAETAGNAGACSTARCCHSRWNSFLKIWLFVVFWSEYLPETYNNRRQ